MSEGYLALWQEVKQSPLPSIIQSGGKLSSEVAVQCSTVYSTVQCTVQYSAQCSTVYSTVQCSAVQCNVQQCTVHCGSDSAVQS